MARGVTVPPVSSYLAFSTLPARNQAGALKEFQAVIFCCTFLKVAFT